MPTPRLDQRVALVTGAGQGIGRSIALRLATEGASVVINDILPEACDDAVDAVIAIGAQATAAPGSVTDPSATDGVVAAAKEAYGTLDILVNNAGITRDQPIHRMTDDDWRLVQEVALWGSF